MTFFSFSLLSNDFSSDQHNNQRSSVVFIINKLGGAGTLFSRGFQESLGVGTEVFVVVGGGAA